MNKYINTYQSSKQVVEDEVDGHHWSPHVSNCYQGLVHDIHPAFLSQNLKHGHEGLWENNTATVSQQSFTNILF